MTIRAQKALGRARGAWARGQIDAALAGFQAALADEPRAVEVLYPMARALAEAGRRHRALAVLEQAAALDPGNNVATILSALVLYDEGDLEETRRRLASLETENLLAATLSALIELEADGARSLRLHRGALWIAEASGRLLAALERILHARGDDEATRFHRRLFVPEDESPRDDGPGETTPPQEEDLEKACASRRDWGAALERTFYRGDLETFTSLWEREGVEEWHDPDTSVYYGYTLAVTGRSQAASEHLRELLAQRPADAWAHFAAGIAATALAERRHAIVSFVRATRLADYDLQVSIRRLLGYLDVELAYVD